MKKQLANKAIAVATITAMSAGIVACGGSGDAGNTTGDSTDAASTENQAADAASAEATEVAEEEGPQIITDENGNPIDLGGMEIIVRDWWSPEEPAEPSNDYEESLDEYREWIQETYNFKIKQVAISDWGTTPQDFVDYVTTGGDDNNYVFILRGDAAIVSAMSNGLMYDLSTLDCLDFTQDKFTKNLIHEQYAKGDAIYAMSAGIAEPRTGVYFNKRLLTEAGIDPESVYDMQADGTWTWDKFEELMAKCQRDTDNDGIDDVYGLTLNESVMTTMAVFSNGGSYIGKDADGKYFYNLEAPETQEALEWVVDMYNKFDNHDPEGAEWDYYKEEFVQGHAAFMVEDEYAGTPGSFLEDMEDEVGFVMFPKGPQMDTYLNVWSNNPAAIPGCYDADRAWKIAFAYNLYTEAPEGYEDYNGYLSTARQGIFDERAIDETITMMSESEHGTVAYHDMIPNLKLGEELTWSIAPNADVAALTEAIADTWKAYVDEANK